MKILLLLNEEIQVNMSAPVLNETPNVREDVDVTYEVNPKCLKKAVKELFEKKDDIEQIITRGCCSTERKFRCVYADTIDFLEKRLNKSKDGLPEEQEIEKKIFDISEKDKELLKKKDVTKLEVAFAKFKPKVKTIAFGIQARWKYLREKTIHRKKIPVYTTQYGFVFSVDSVDFLALENTDDESVNLAYDILQEKKSSSEPYIVKEYDSKSKRFIYGYIPLLTDNRREVIRKTVRNVAVVVFVVAGIYLLYNSVYKSAENTAIQSEIQSIYYDGDTSKDVEEEDKIKSFKKLKSINNEIVGWITVPHTNIDYPVLYHKGDTLDSQYYLYNNYEKNYSEYGSIFIDFRCQQGEKSKNVVMHGHHMMDGSMFSNLLKYGKTSIDMDFYKKSPTVTFTTPDEGESVYKIISVFKTTGDKNHPDYFNYMQGDFSSGAEFMNFVYNVRARSLVNTDVDVNEKDKLITLSTCSYEVHENYRTVVVARKTRAGESEKVNVANAEKNKHPYFPSDYYYRFGGTQPKLTSFKTEFKKGNIDWYDGGGNLRGSQRLTGGKFVEDRTTTTTTKPSTSSTSSSTSTTKSTKPSTKKTSTTKATKPAPKYYTVKFLNAKGKVIKTQKVKEGSSAKAPSAPKKATTYNYKYVFAGWNKSYKNVHSNLTVKPLYKSIKRVHPTKPKATTPKTTKPKTTTPKTTKPKATTPKVTKPKVTVPKTTKPKTTIPKTTQPQTTVPQTTRSLNGNDLDSRGE